MQAELLSRIHNVLDDIGPLVVACSGGIDSMLLSWVSHRHMGEHVTVAHAVSPAVTAEATQRVEATAQEEGWALKVVQSGEFADEEYLSNPVNRCYFCKSNLYSNLNEIVDRLDGNGTIVSGANLDDLGEYRPGLDAASEKNVRHPWIEANFSKENIRELARSFDLPFAELPASPCLASRLYTGTRVTPARLQAVHTAETWVKERTDIEIVRCRLDGDQMRIEVSVEDRSKISAELIAEIERKVASIEPAISQAELDDAPYKPGRAFVEQE